MVLRFIFDPLTGTNGVNRDKIITVNILDPNRGVDGYSTHITLNGVDMVLDGYGVEPFEVTVTPIETTPGFVDGYTYTIDAEDDFPFNTAFEIAATINNAIGIEKADSATFRTFSDPIAPSLTNVTPGNNQREVSLQPEITFTARDAYDVAFELTNVTLNGDPAITNGEVQSGFTMELSRVSGGTLGVNPGDGYAVLLRLDEPLDYNKTVVLNISILDRSEGNERNRDITWFTVSPAPPLVDISPQDGETDVPVGTNISFDIIDDGYGVDISTLNAIIDEVSAINNNVFQSPRYTGTVDALIDGYRYAGEIDPRFLLAGSTVHRVTVRVAEPISGNIGSSVVNFTTEAPPENPETIYVGNQDGVQYILSEDIGFNSELLTLMDGYFVNSLHARLLEQVNRLLVGTRDHGALIFATNFVEPTLLYSVGDEITHAYLSAEHDGTIYLANKSRDRIDVYYSILFDDVGRDTPDVFYAIPDGYSDGYAIPGMLDGYFTDMVITEKTSTVDSDSASIFIGTNVGAMRIETDESVPGNTEINGQLITYGIQTSGYDFDILEGTSNNIASLDVNTRLNRLYVATRGETSSDNNAVTYIDLDGSVFDGAILEDRLINPLVNDLDFTDN